MLELQLQLQVSTTNTTMPENKHLKGSDDPAPPPPPPLPNHRRPRVREVSSRFMSPSPSMSTVNRRQQQRSSESDDENSESSFPIGRKNQRVMKPFKESTNEGFGNLTNPYPYPSKSCSTRPSTPCPSSYSRPDTPIPSISVSSRYRLTHHHHHHHHNHHNRSSINASSSAAAKMLQFSGMSLGKGNASLNSHDDSSITCSTQSLPELCSDTDRDRDTVSIGSVAEKIGSSSSSLSRSVSLSSSGIDHLIVKGSEKIHGSVSKQCRNVNHSGNFGKLGGLSLPPVVPQCSKPSLDTRKGRKGSSHEEDVHFLRLLHNKYLQWRFANAKAASAMKNQQKESEKALYSRAMKISEMRDSVNRKRAELELLRRSKTLSAILEDQIPYLDEWSAIEEDYSVSITEAIQALLNASVQLPIGGDVRVDVREVGEALNSASKIMETIASNIQRFITKAEETDTSMSELARVVGGERALIGENADLLSKIYKSQVEESSLRGQLIQLHSICDKNKNKESATDNSFASQL